MRAAVATIRSNIAFTVIEKKWHLEIFSKNNTAQLKQKQTQSFWRQDVKSSLHRHKTKKCTMQQQSKLLSNGYPCVYKLSCGCGVNTLEKQKRVCSLDQLNTKKIAWQENGKRRVQRNIPKFVIGG